MDERHQSAAALSRPRAAQAAGGPGFLRLARAGSPGTTSRPRTAIRDRRFLLLALLVQRQAPVEPATGRNARVRSPGFPLLCRLGKRVLDPPLDRRGKGGLASADILVRRRCRSRAMAGGALC